MVVVMNMVLFVVATMHNDSQRASVVLVAFPICNVPDLTIEYVDRRPKWVEIFKILRRRFSEHVSGASGNKVLQRRNSDCARDTCTCEANAIP